MGGSNVISHIQLHLLSSDGMKTSRFGWNQEEVLDVSSELLISSEVIGCWVSFSCCAVFTSPSFCLINLNYVSDCDAITTAGPQRGRYINQSGCIILRGSVQMHQISAGDWNCTLTATPQINHDYQQAQWAGRANELLIGIWGGTGRGCRLTREEECGDVCPLCPRM